jgi:signal transduction histidine kinase
MTSNMMEKAEISASYDVEDELPAFLGDGVKLRQILINLLSNAMKFTPPGGRITVTAKRGSDRDLVLTIADTGIGIPADKLAIALSPFGQVDSDLNRRYAGVGLGLPLTKRLVELHDGTMGIDSETGKGTRITIRFPAHRFRRRTHYAESQDRV